MGLDAHVHCACFERGLTRSAPPTGLVLGVAEEDGSLALAEPATLEDWMAMDRWRWDACDHPGGVAIRRRIGNSAMVALLNEHLATQRDAYPLLLSLVLYDGVHSGDCINPDVARSILTEIDALAIFPERDAERHQAVQEFGRQMRDLVEASLSFSKPIVF